MLFQRPDRERAGCSRSSRYETEIYQKGEKMKIEVPPRVVIDWMADHGFGPVECVCSVEVEQKRIIHSAPDNSPILGEMQIIHAYLIVQEDNEYVETK